MSRFNGVRATKGCRDLDGATFTVSVDDSSLRRGQLMMADRPISVPKPAGHLARLKALLPLHHASTPAVQLECSVDSIGLPPEEPPHESSWFAGFNVVPIILFTFSPSWEHQDQWMNA